MLRVLLEDVAVVTVGIGKDARLPLDVKGGGGGGGRGATTGGGGVLGPRLPEFEVEGRDDCKSASSSLIDRSASRFFSLSSNG